MLFCGYKAYFEWNLAEIHHFEILLDLDDVETVSGAGKGRLLSVEGSAGESVALDVQHGVGCRLGFVIQNDRELVRTGFYDLERCSRHAGYCRYGGVT